MTIKDRLTTFSGVNVSDGGKVNEMVREFLLEGFEEISRITEGLTKLEQDPGNSEIINSIYRSMHTIKGASAFLQFSEIETFTHFVENLLDDMRNETLKATPEIIDILLKASDHITAALNQVELTGNDEGCSNQDFIDSVKQALSVTGGVAPSENQPEDPAEAPAEPVAEAAPEQPAAEPVVDAAPEAVQQPAPESVMQTAPEEPVANDVADALDDLKAELDKVDVQGVTSTPADELPGATEVTRSFAPTIEEGKGEVEEAMSKHHESSISDSVIKVHVNLLDKMMNVVGELVLNRNQILQHSSMSDSPELVRLANELNNITSELQTDIMATRMQPIGSVLGKFERLVRDLSRATGKKVALKIEGQDTELDRTIIEAIKDPLTHLVRNSLDHGIELPENRASEGKDPIGTLLVKAYHEGGQVTIEIRDDGKGLCSEKILAKAMEKGLVSEEKAGEMSENQIHHLIFTPGFSTAEKVTNISGRGVGMDVVKTNIEKIGGQVDVFSRTGEGTIFKLKIPLTLAIIPALVVRANKEPFAIPQINLVELVRMDPSNSNEIEKVGNAEFLRLRGELLPVLRLNKILGYDEDPNKKEDDLNVVILNAEGLVYGLVVDAIQDTQEIVVKPLGQHLKELDVYAGATIMGDGDVALILDAMGLVQGHTKDSDIGKQKDSEVSAEASIGFHEGQEMILFSLNSSATFGVPLALVNRLEEFKKEQVELVGQRPVVQYRNTVMPIINLNTSLDLESESELKEAFSVLVIKNREKYFGLMVNQVLDIQVSESSELDSNHGKQKGILGSAFVGGSTVSVVDIFRVIEQSSGEEVKPPQALCGVGKTALVVDDSPFFRRIEIEAMKDQGFRVIEASNGQEALDKLQSNEVDIILSDIEMPVMDGYDLAKQVRSKENYKSLPMVAITTKFDDESKAEGEACGFSIYLEKFNKDEVIEAVSRFVGKAS